MGSFIQHVIDHLPSSKRAVRNVHTKLDRLEQQVSGLQAMLALQESLMHEQLQQLQRYEQLQQELRTEVLTNRAQASLFDWSLFRRDGEDDRSAQQRFFAQLPQATGTVRLIQRGCAGLLQEFAAIAHKHQLPYWVDFGTLLGAVRHQGFIPWDDDVDLSMMRDDITRLCALLKDDPELVQRYRVTLIYDPYACCRQLRFRYADDKNPCFLDIFFYDYKGAWSSQERDRFIELRRQLKADLHSLSFYNEWCEQGYWPVGHPHTDEVEAVFAKYQRLVHKEGILAEKTTSQGIVCGLDNVDGECAYTVANDDIFPLQTMRFESFEVLAPVHVEAVLAQLYGDIYQLPDDIISHFQHIDRAALEDPAQARVIEEGIASNPWI